ncbi:hypothetical protein [Acinetobacter defluvii]|uniref:hypothetical protein n=1 Tax=Acinetobacter defluvii TaxID=1871111 RepID=UPI003AF61C54
MSGKNSVVSMTLQLNGKQAQQVLQQFLQTQKTSAAEILKTNRNLEGVLRQQAQQTSIQAKQYQQMSRLVQQQHSALAQSTVQTQATLRTNQLLERVLQQQVRQSTLLTQNNRNQNRDYQLQLNILRQQVAAAERLRQQLEQAGRASRDMNHGAGGGVGGAGNFLNNAAGAIGGAVAGGMILNGAFRPAISYDEQLARMAVIAANGKGTAEMHRLKPDLRKTVDQAALYGGSALQDTASALDSLLAKGKYDYDESKAILPTISEAAFVGNTSAAGMSVLADALATYGLRGEQNLQKSFAMAIRSGELGGYELRDMQQDLARQLALATSAGYSGHEGLASLLSLNQVSMDVSGNAGEAGNNVVNLLQKLNSRELSDSMAKAVVNTEGLATRPSYSKKGKYLGEVFDWNQQQQVGRSQGKFGAEVLGDVIDHQLSNNSDYQALRKKIATASGAERKKLLGDMANIALGGEIGQIIADRQFLMATLGQTLARYNIDENGVNRIDGLKNETLKATYDQVVKPTGTFLNSQTFGKEGTAKTNAQIVRQDSFDRIAGGYGTVLDKFSELTQQFPAFSQGLFLSTTGLTALAASAGVASLAMRAGSGAGAAGGAAAGAAGGAVMGAVRTAGQVGLAGVLGYGIGTAARNMYMQTETGRNFDEWGGEKIAQLLAAFGNEEAKASLANMEKYDEMIQQQQEANQQNAQVIRELQKLPSAIGNSIKIPAPSFNSLQQSQQNAVGERQGAVPFMLQKH